MEILIGICGVLFALWMVNHVENRPVKHNANGRTYNLRNDEDYSRYLADSRIESLTDDIIQLHGTERDARLLRLDERERWQVESNIRTIENDNSWRPLSQSLRVANPSDYQEWLNGYRAKGGQVTHQYNYNMPDRFFICINDLELPAWYGANSISVIVPEHIQLTCKDGLGHNNVFYMEDFQAKGISIPSYRNIKT